MATQVFGGPVVLTATPVAVVTTGANEAVVFTNLIAMNTDTEARLVTLYQVPDGGSADATTQILTQTVYAGQSTTIPAGAVAVANGASLFAEADVTSVVNLSLNYYRLDQQA